MSGSEYKSAAREARGALRMSQQALRDSWTAYAEQQGLIKPDAAIGAPDARGNKYGAKRTAVGDIVFDSKREATYYEELKLREIAGEISELELQPAYLLHVMELYRSGPIQIRTIGTFTADFSFVELVGLARGEVKTVDVKSEITRKGEAYRLRKKLAEAIHGMTVTEI